MHRLAPDDLAGTMEDSADFVLRLPLVAENNENYRFESRTILRRSPGEPLNPARMDLAEIEKLKLTVPPHVFLAQYQQRPTIGGSGLCTIDRLTFYDVAPSFELVIHSWDIAATKGGGDWTVCTKFGLAKNAEGRDILYLYGLVKVQVELPDVRELIEGEERLEKPALIVMDGNGIGRATYQELTRKGFKHILPGKSMATGGADNLKVRRFYEALPNIYDGLVRFPNAMKGREKLLDELAAFPGGKYDDQVDSLSYVAAYRGQVIPQARRHGLSMGRIQNRSPFAGRREPPPKSRDQLLYDRRIASRDD
jgi:predicted phage terminase large subunit-like protein